MKVAIHPAPSLTGQGFWLRVKRVRTTASQKQHRTDSAAYSTA